MNTSYQIIADVTTLGQAHGRLIKAKVEYDEYKTKVYNRLNDYLISTCAILLELDEEGDPSSLPDWALKGWDKVGYIDSVVNSSWSEETGIVTFMVKFSSNRFPDSVEVPLKYMSENGLKTLKKELKEHFEKVKLDTDKKAIEQKAIKDSLEYQEYLLMKEKFKDIDEQDAHGD